MTEALLKYLESNGISLHDCRGQSYDNAANMSGKYCGMQALIKDQNGLCIYVPCCAHSMNLVGKAAANTCSATVKFFDFVQEVHVFFTASPSRYQILTEALSSSQEKTNKKKLLTPKGLSDTRWSCSHDAIKALVVGYDKFKVALRKISINKEEKDIVHNAAAGLHKEMCKIEIALYSLFWNEILERFNATNKILQSPEMVLQSAVDALTSLKAFVESKQECFAQYEERAKKFSGSTEYSQAQRRQRNRNFRLNPLAYETGDEVQQSPSDQFRTTSFIPVIDQFNVSLKDRINAYKNVCEYIGFLNRLDEMKPNEIMMSANNLVNKYKPDLKESFGNELVQFSALLKLYMDDYDANAKVPKELFFYKILNANNFISSFRNVEIH